VGRAIDLAEFVAERLSQKTGFSRAVTYDIARAAAHEWSVRERLAVTTARDKALAVADAKRASEGKTKREG
jgi:hypothetical protein